MLNFYPEEVAEELHQLLECSHEKGIFVTRKWLRETADKLTGHPLRRPGPTNYDWVYRHPYLECVIVTCGNGQLAATWLKPKTIDEGTWYTLYVMGWRPARFPLPVTTSQEPRYTAGPSQNPMTP